MKPRNPTPTPVPVPAASSAQPAPVNDVKDSGDKLNLTPEQAEREARKLREYKDGLDERRSPDDSSVRTSPLGRRQT